MLPCIHNNVAMNCSNHVNAIFYNYSEKQVIKCYGDSERIKNNNYPSLARNACFYATTSNCFREFSLFCSINNSTLLLLTENHLSRSDSGFRAVIDLLWLQVIVSAPLPACHALLYHWKWAYRWPLGPPNTGHQFPVGGKPLCSSPVSWSETEVTL